jgi:hypothetical protein
LSETAITLRAEPGEGPPPGGIRFGLIFTPEPSSGSPASSRREHVPFIGPLDTFKELVFAAAIRGGIASAPGAVIVTDGSQWVKGLRDSAFPGAKILLDIGMLEEEILRFAANSPDMTRASAVKAASKIIDLAVEGKATEAFDAARKLAPGTRPRGRRRLMKLLKGPGTGGGPEGGYYREGFSSALGPVERRQRGFLETRLRHSGMRWNLEHAQNILALSAKETSGLWETDVAARTLARFGPELPSVG